MIDLKRIRPTKPAEIRAALEITEVQFRGASKSCSPVVAYCEIVLCNCFVIHDAKIIIGKRGRLFLAMPQRRVSDRCPECLGKNPLTSRFCGDCGSKLDRDDVAILSAERGTLYKDICHPINEVYRSLIEQEVLLRYTEAVDAGTIRPHSSTASAVRAA